MTSLRAPLSLPTSSRSKRSCGPDQADSMRNTLGLCVFRPVLLQSNPQPSLMVLEYILQNAIGQNEQRAETGPAPGAALFRSRKRGAPKSSTSTPSTAVRQRPTCLNRQGRICAMVYFKQPWEQTQTYSIHCPHPSRKQQATARTPPAISRKMAPHIDNAACLTAARFPAWALEPFTAVNHPVLPGR